MYNDKRNHNKLQNLKIMATTRNITNPLPPTENPPYMYQQPDIHTILRISTTFLTVGSSMTLHLTGFCKTFST